MNPIMSHVKIAVEAEVVQTTKDNDEERAHNRVETLALLREIGACLAQFDRMVNFIKEACEEANCDTSLKNLISMLREACTVLFAKAKAKLLIMSQPSDPNASYVSAQHLRQALHHARKGYEKLEDMLIILERVKQQKVPNRTVAHC